MIKYVLEKEFKQFFRNPFLPRLVVLFPIVIMVVMPLVTTMDIKGIRITVVDNDGSTTSEKLVNDIAHSTYFELENVTASYNQALQDIENGKADVVLEIPAQWEKNLVAGKTAPVQISINTVNQTKGSLGGSYLRQILQQFAAKTAGLKAPINAQTVQGVPQLTVVTQNRYNVYMEYKNYMIPALMVILLIVLCGFLPALNIVSEKERGTIEQINVTPLPKFLFILAKLIPYWLMGFVVLTLCMVLAYVVYGLYPLGNILIIYLFTLLFVLAISGFGLVISNYSNTMQQALFVMFFFVMIFQLMSGLFTPIRSMPEWAQTITQFIPPRYYIQMMRLMYLKGATFYDLLTEFFALLGFVVFFSSWAVISYKKST